MPLGIKATQRLLDTLGHTPRKPLGQNFLVEGNIVRKSLELGEVVAGDQVVEIGPGLGTLSAEMLAAGATVYAIEYDSTLAAHLREGLGKDYAARFFLKEGDAVRSPLAGFAEETPSTTGPFKVVANLPYAISTPWIEGVLSGGVLPERMVLMMQRETAERLGAAPGTKAFGAVSIFLASAYREVERHAVSPSCFYPEPAVESVLVRYDRLAPVLRYKKPVRQAIRMVFTQRRKQLGALLKKNLWGEVLRPWFAQCCAEGLPQDIRAEAVPLAFWQRLAQTSDEAMNDAGH